MRAARRAGLDLDALKKSVKVCAVSRDEKG